jgi:hypothetical protein
VLHSVVVAICITIRGFLPLANAAEDAPVDTSNAQLLTPPELEAPVAQIVLYPDPLLSKQSGVKERSG